jgi:hypothetical protein
MKNSKKITKTLKKYKYKKKIQTKKGNKYSIRKQYGGAPPWDFLEQEIIFATKGNIKKDLLEYYKQRYETVTDKDSEYKSIMKEFETEDKQKDRLSYSNFKSEIKKINPNLSNEIIRMGFNEYFLNPKILLENILEIYRPVVHKTRYNEGAAAAYKEPSNNFTHVSDNTFTIITTGLGDWGSDEKPTNPTNIIDFYYLIMESLIMNTFFGKFSEFQAIHYDSHLLDSQITIIKSIEKQIKEKYNLKKITSKFIKKDLEKQEKELNENVKHPEKCIHLDFANIDFANIDHKDARFHTSYLQIQGFPIKKVYFGYWGGNYPDIYSDIIRKIKLVNIRKDRDGEIEIETVNDRMNNLDITHPKLLYSIPECNDLPRNVITIPGIRTMYQWGGYNPIEIYKMLWDNSPDKMKILIQQMQETLFITAFIQLKDIYEQNEQSKFCKFCHIRKCLLDTDIKSTKELHNSLCRICFLLINKDNKEDDTKMRLELQKYIPPC